MNAEKKLIFVYGTLKRGGSNHEFLAGQTFVGEARTTSGFTLYDLNGYPGMIADVHDHAGVTGEVWSVDVDTLARLDALEGLSENLYRRERVPLLAPFAEQTVEGYLYARTIQGRRKIGATWKE